MVRPQGAFYLFPQSPTADEMEFVEMSQQKNLLVDPGVSFGQPGYFRVSYCVNRKIIENSLPVFQQLATELGLNK